MTPVSYSIISEINFNSIDFIFIDFYLNIKNSDIIKHSIFYNKIDTFLEEFCFLIIPKLNYLSKEIN